ncbi:hypothetical protein CBR_g4698 [Chara braunii]|uniref:Reverse transcriptase domain-containing protein n=1 Tax=Chara braunii TaxID=69332 RepID=A0A388KII8_CHABU|nr:hypothetical protein CBR_g4698 [Chara braunii]|eukprot:GBG69871.1 hypothetical protein CBR_g4698 [Chara braunii]
MNDLFRPWLDRFVVVYLNDILVFSRTLQEHQGHLRQFLEKLGEANFKINVKKCEWAKTQVLYLGHILDGDGIKPEDSKIAAIRDWPTPRTLTELRSFLGLANYYRKFVRNFSTIAAPLRRLLKKEAIWQWDKDCTSALKKLKCALIEYPVLKVADPSLPFVVTMDVSQYGIGVVLQQDDDNGYRPVEFMSARMPSKKVATSTYERKLYALSESADVAEHCHYMVNAVLQLAARGRTAGSPSSWSWYSLFQVQQSGIECPSCILVALHHAAELCQLLMLLRQEEKDVVVREFEAMTNPLDRQALENEKKLEWKLRLAREKKRRREEASRMAKEMEKVHSCRREVEAHQDIRAKMDKILSSIEILGQAWTEQQLTSEGQHMALHSIRLGFRDFALDIVTHMGSQFQRLKEGAEKYCTDALEGAKAIAAAETEARPRKEPVKLKFPVAYGGKPEENFDNWEVSVNSYVYLQHIVQDEQVLVAFHALKDEAASFARSLAREASCENNMVAYSKVTTIPQFLKLLRERFTDLRRGVKASDKLQTIHSRQWRNARALKAVMDELIVVPDHGVTEAQLVQLFNRAMPEPLRGHFFDESQQPTMTYDALSREVVFCEGGNTDFGEGYENRMDIPHNLNPKNFTGEFSPVRGEKDEDKEEEVQEVIEINSGDETNEISRPREEGRPTASRLQEGPFRWEHEFGPTPSHWFEQWISVIKRDWIIKVRELMEAGVAATPLDFYNERELREIAKRKREIPTSDLGVKASAGRQDEQGAKRDRIDDNERD